MITATYYISTGEKSAMFTLRCKRVTDDPRMNQFMPDVYLRTLAGINGEERAIEKARDYVDAIRDRIESEDFKVVFGGVWDEPTGNRRGKLSVRDTANIETIEAGTFPFGKHAGSKIVDGPDGYILFFADKLATANDAVTAALAAACQGVALERGLIAKRDAARAERDRLNALSQHVGSVGERMTFTGEIVGYFFKQPTNDSDGYELTTVRTDEGNLVKWYNNQLGERGDRVSFKATVKAHCDYKGVKSTRVNRPKAI